MLLENKVAIITGAGSGFGRATSLLFGEHGAKIVAVDYKLDAADTLVAELQNAGHEAVAVTADVGVPEQIEGFVRAAVERYGQIDVLFINPGVYYPGNVEVTTVDDWKRAVDVNLTSVSSRPSTPCRTSRRPRAPSSVPPRPRESSAFPMPRRMPRRKVVSSL